MESSALNVVAAYFQSFQLESVVDALRHVEGYPGMSVSDVRGVGCTGAHLPHKGERTEVDPFERRTRLEIFCRATIGAGIVEAIRAAAHSGNPRDGEVFVGRVAQAQRIRSGERGEATVRP